MKKVLIITLAQGSNYGGMLQAYALQTSIKNLGYDVHTTFTKGPLFRRLIKSFPGARLLIRILKNRPKANNSTVTTRFTQDFVNNYINMIDFDKAFWTTKLNGYDAYVTGSDQVWRSTYTYVPHNMLNFAPSNAVKISYAGSFGTDNLSEYKVGLVGKTKKLANRMTALSIRESSGVKIAKNDWQVDAVQNVDPTLLVSQEDYLAIIQAAQGSTHESRGDLFSYVLDPMLDKQGIASSVAALLQKKIFTVIDSDENSGKPMPPVEQWLRSFRDAEFVVTDSFHGTVFSIIFNKPFIAIGNKSRGLARFTSLLKMFGLEDRLVTDVSEVTPELIKAKIDWKNVNAIKKREQERAMKYLRKYLR